MILTQLKEWYRKIDRFSDGRLAIIKNAFVSFSETRASQAAASLAYYAIFSLFPLMLVLIAGGSFFLNSEQVLNSVTQLMINTFPTAPKLISENLRQVLDARGTVGLISLITLLWSASGVFTNLAFNINRAWPGASPRNFLENRLVGLGMVLELGMLLFLSLALSTIPNLAPIIQTEAPLIYYFFPWQLVSMLGSLLMTFLLFFSLYRWVPNLRVNWKATFWSSLVTTAAWKAATSGYSWYVNSSFGRYKLVYGSLGAIVALLFLIYIMALVTLFGAHLTAAIDRWEKDRVKPEPKAEITESQYSAPPRRHPDVSER